MFTNPKVLQDFVSKVQQLAIQHAKLQAVVN
jgi:hypothetical protein